MHPDLQVIAPDEFAIGETRFRVISQDYHKYKTTENEIIILKDLRWFEYYAQLIRDLEINNLVELGIFEGGSAILFALLFDRLNIAAIDLRQPDQAVLDHISRLGLDDRVHLFYGTSQDDKKAVEKALTDVFGNNSIDMVVDDASHLYAQTRGSFEILFPRLRYHGVYVIEDWAWAHWQGVFQNEQGLDLPALSNLAFELTMLLGSRPDLIERLDIRGGTVAAFKSGIAPLPDFELSEAYLMRGKLLPLI
jgi:cephalosporin hydroxylase